MTKSSSVAATTCRPSARPGRSARSRSGGGRRRSAPGGPPPHGLDRVDLVRIGDRPQLVAAPVGSVACSAGPVRPRGGAQPRVGDRPQIGEMLARVARSSSSRSVLALGVVSSWGRMPVAGRLDASAPMTPTVWRGPPGGPASASGSRKTRPSVPVEDPAVPPGVEEGGGPLVAVLPRPSAVAHRRARGGRCWRAAGLRGRSARLGDDVVRRAHHVVERRHVGTGVAQAGKRLESGHDHTA